MKLVIDIEDYDREYIVNDGYHIPDQINWKIAKAIIDGKPLPKGHGRLIDADAFITKVKADRKHSAYLRSWTANDVLNALDNSYAPTIIERSNSDDK